MAHLYLTDSDVKLGLRQGQVVVENVKDGTSKAIPIASVTDISVFGQPQISTQLIRECLSRNIPIGYYSNDGHYFGNISSTVSIDPIRQKRQVYLTDDDSFCITWAHRIVSAKIRNSLTLLQHYPEIHEFDESELRPLYHSLDYLDVADSVEMTIGFEGSAARGYFSCLPKLLLNQDFAFKGRSSRPPKDAFNSMLSFGYSLLYRDIIGAIERRGLHPYFAFMHKLKYGHAALASDLIEEYRAPLVDRTVLELVNQGDVQISDFYVNEAGAVYMTRDASRRFTRVMSEVIARGERYFVDAGSNKTFGFQAMLDKKLDLLIDAIECRDASLYVPYIWRSE